MKINIGIKKLKVKALIGVYPKEWQKPQTLFIDLEATLKNPFENDELKTTIDYDFLAQICEDQAKNKRYNLIESLAEAILNSSFNRLPISKMKISIYKPKAIKTALAGYVTLEREIK